MSTGADASSVHRNLLLSANATYVTPEMFASAEGNPTVRTPQDFGGNQIIERLGPGLYAAYEHLQTGSVLVHRGQHLHTGQVIARLGNTGNTTFPHLHFGIQDGPDLLTSNALPFEIYHYTLEGTLLPARRWPTSTSRLAHGRSDGPIR